MRNFQLILILIFSIAISANEILADNEKNDDTKIEETKGMPEVSANNEKMMIQKSRKI